MKIWTDLKGKVVDLSSKRGGDRNEQNWARVKSQKICATNGPSFFQLACLHLTWWRGGQEMSKWHPVAGALAAVRLYTKKSQQRPSQLPLNGVVTASVHLYISQMNHFNGALVLRMRKNPKNESRKSGCTSERFQAGQNHQLT